MGKKHFFAVVVGRQIGIYDNWDACNEQVNRFPNAKFKGFSMLDETKEWYHEQTGQPITEEILHFITDKVEAQSVKSTVAEINYHVEEENESGTEEVLTDDLIGRLQRKVIESRNHPEIIPVSVEAYCKKYKNNDASIANLSDDQKRAVGTISGHALLFAVPGSGKTAVIVARTGYLLHGEHGKSISPNSVMTLTFGKKAAEEMGERYRAAFPEDSTNKEKTGPYFKTIHSFCLTEVISRLDKKVSSTLQLPCPSILRGGVLFCSVIVHNKVMNILQKIFTDHYEEIKYTMHTRPVVMDNIDRMINCGDPSFGGAMYACPDCGHLRFVPFRCKSRFCPTCGVKYAQERSTSMSFKLIKCTHRHCVFTIDEQLRPFFLKDRSLLNCLFRAVRSVMLRLFYKLNKSRNFVPGFICVLHTFGRPLEWNPHIHCLISQGAFSDDGFWRTVRYFNFTYLRKSFQTALLNEMELIIGPSFKAVKSAVYKKCINGFYVYAKPNLSNTNTVIKYISRYLGRPAIALKRIDSYDGLYVTFHYNKHEDNSFVRKTIPVLDFIKLLIQHIPDWNFKMTRYYGLYARNRKLDSSLIKSIHKSKHKLFRSFTKWRYNILLSFGYNPLCCPVCGSDMLLAEIRYNHRHVSLEQLFEKAKLKALCRSS